MQNVVLDERSIRAITLLAEGKVSAERTYNGHHLVESATTEGACYLVTAHSCTCGDAKYRHTTCKHQIAIRLAAVLSGAAIENEEQAAF
jgi:hypothetical protein